MAVRGRKPDLERPDPPPQPRLARYPEVKRLYRMIHDIRLMLDVDCFELAGVRRIVQALEETRLLPRDDRYDGLPPPSETGSELADMFLSLLREPGVDELRLVDFHDLTGRNLPAVKIHGALELLRELGLADCRRVIEGPWRPVQVWSALL